MNKSSIKRIFREGTWVLTGQVISAVGSLGLVRLLTDYLEPSNYGHLSLILTYVGFVNQVLTGGVISGIGRFYPTAKYKDDISQYLTSILKFQFFFSVIISFVSLMFYLTFLNKGTKYWILFSCIYSILLTLNSSLNSIQNAARQRMIVTLNYLLDISLKILMCYFFVIKFKVDVDMIILFYSVSTFFVILFQFYCLRKEFSIHNLTSINKKSNWFREIFLYSWPFSIWGIFTWAQQSSDKWLLNFYLSEFDVGIFSVVYQYGYAPITLIFGIIISLFSPIVFEKSAHQNYSSSCNSTDILLRNIVIIGILFSVLSFIITFFCHIFLFKNFVSNSYRKYSYLLPFMVLSGGIFSIGQLLAIRLLNDFKTSALMNVKIFTSIIGVILNLISIKLYGLKGAVYSSLFYSFIYSYSVFFVVSNLKSNNEK